MITTTLLPSDLGCTSASVASVVNEFGPDPETVATAKFLEMMDAFFDNLNLCSTTEYQKKCKKDI